MSYSLADGKTYTLYGKATTGKKKLWTIRVFKDRVRASEVGEPGNDFIDIATIEMGRGYEDGKTHYEFRILTEGKNIGKSNETSTFEQAILEAESRIKRKLDQNYRPTKEELDDLPIGPMLAHDFTKRGHSLEYPCFVQPKLNGVRCLVHRVSENKIEFYSRMGKEFTTLDHLVPALLPVLNTGEVWDGEIYKHGWNFQRIVSAVKKFNDDTPELELHVYDMVSEISPYDARFAHIEEQIQKIPVHGNVKFVDVKVCKDVEHVDKWHTAYVKKGYEGLILRNEAGVYKPGQRSADLQKYKHFMDAEYEITDHKADSNREVVFTCKTKDGNVFSVKPRGTREERRSLAAQSKGSFNNKLLTVRYQELSNDGVPIFPVGIGIRDYE